MQLNQIPKVKFKYDGYLTYFFFPFFPSLNVELASFLTILVKHWVDFRDKECFKQFSEQ